MLAVIRPGAGRSRSADELWLVDRASGRGRELYAQPHSLDAPITRVEFSPDGRWLLFAEDPFNSASIAADGVPWFAVSTAGGSLHAIASIVGEPDFTTWCGRSFIYVTDHSGREVTLGDGIAAAAPPGWSSRALLPAASKISWNAMACRPGTAQLAIAAGPSHQGPFGHEDRSLWLVPTQPGGTPRRPAATVPPSGETDELPRWSADGRWLLFVRTRPGGRYGASGSGALYALDLAANRRDRADEAVGITSNFYGSYAWSTQIAWHR